jgi:general stress protein CsbA
MAALPDDWTEPDSPTGALVDVGWMALCILGFGALALVEPFFFEVPVTTTRIAVSVLVGLVLAVALVGLSTESERAREFWTGDFARRFAVLFAFVVGMQLLLRLAPGWTVLVTLATAVAAVPVRAAAYYRHRGR